MTLGRKETMNRKIILTGILAALLGAAWTVGAEPVDAVYARRGELEAGFHGAPLRKGRGNDSQALRLTSIENKASAWGLGAGLAAGALTAMAVPSLILSPRDSHGTAAFRLPIACAAGAGAGLLAFVFAGAAACSVAKRVYLSHQNLKKEAGD